MGFSTAYDEAQLHVVANIDAGCTVCCGGQIGRSLAGVCHSAACDRVRTRQGSNKGVSLTYPYPCKGRFEETIDGSANADESEIREIISWRVPG